MYCHILNTIPSDISKLIVNKRKNIILVGCKYEDFQILEKEFPDCNFRYDLSWLDKIDVEPTYEILLLKTK